MTPDEADFRVMCMLDEETVPMSEGGVDWVPVGGGWAVCGLADWPDGLS